MLKDVQFYVMNLDEEKCSNV